MKEVLALGDRETWNPENSLVWMITCKPITDRKNHGQFRKLAENRNEETH